MTLPPERTGAALAWALDQCVVTEHGLFAHGWVAHPQLAVTRVRLELRERDHLLEAVPVRYGENRADVARAHAGLSPASGFVAFAASAVAARATALQLEVTLADGSVQRLALPWAPAPTGAGVRPARAAQARAQWGRLGRAWGHLRRGHWRLLWDRVRVLGGYARARDRRSGAIAAELVRVARGATLVLDHAMGGGANLYADALVARERAQGRDVLCWRFVPAAMRHALTHQPAAPGAASRTWWVGPSAWDDLLGCARVGRVVYNNSVSFPDPLHWPAALMRFQQAGVPVRFLVHDFFAICPSHFLLDARQVHCGLPDVSVCRGCLPRIEDPLLSVFPTRDIDAWRLQWGACLAACDEIVCFSDSTRRLLLRAYPTLPAGRIAVQPHEVAYLQGRHAPPADAAPLRVAVVGKIDHHKGAGVVDALLREIERTHAPVQIRVIGTYGGALRSPALTETGPYERARLAELLNRDGGVHLALMPSVYPETFSYVAHELIALHVPLLTLDLGAQADAARQYALGRVAASSDAPALLDEILRFGRQLRTADTPHP